MAVPDTQSNTKLHPDEDLKRRDGVPFQCKFEGTYSVPEAKGLAVVQKACEQMREGKGRRKEMGVKQAPMVAVQISVQGIEVFSGEEVVTKTHMLKVPIEKISYIARDPSDRHYLAIVYETSPPKPADKPEFECTLFKHDINKTREMVLTLNQAFDLAYEMRVKEGKIPKVSLKEQVDIYRSRLKQLSELLPSDKLADFLRLLNVQEVTEIRGVGAAGKDQAPHTMVTQPSVDPQQQQQKQQQQQQPPPQAPAPSKPLLQAAAVVDTSKQQQQQSEKILDFGNDDAWAPVQQQQQQQRPPPAKPASNPFGGGAESSAPQQPPQQPPQQQQQQPMQNFFGEPFVPPPASSGAQQQQQPQQQAAAPGGGGQQQDLMRLGFGPLDSDLEFDPLKMN